MTYSDNDILVISPEWGLRRNGSRTLLLDLDVTQQRYLVLHALDSLIVPLFNGMRSVIDVAGVLTYVLDISSSEALAMVYHSIAGINTGGEKLLTLQQLGNRDFTVYKPEDFLSGPDNRAYPQRLERPLSLTIAPTHSCQTRCRYCYAELRHISQGAELSVGSWLALIDQAVALGIERVSVLGGDIFAYSGILNILAHLIKNNLDFFISTKYHIDKIMARRLAEIGLGRRCIQFSMDAPNAEIADYLTGSTGYFNRALDSISNLMANGLNIRCKGVLTSYNARMVPELVRLWYSMGVRDMMFVDYSRSYYHHTDDLFISPEDSEWAAEQILHLTDELHDVTIIYGAQSSSIAKDGLSGNKSDAEKWLKWKARARCSAGSSSMLVWPDGLVTLCEQIPQTEEHIVGDVRKQSIMDIWNSERLLCYIYPDRQLFANSPCHDCDHFDDCHRASRHCFRDALFAYESRYMPPPLCPMASPAPRMF